MWIMRVENVRMDMKIEAGRKVRIEIRMKLAGCECRRNLT